MSEDKENAPRREQKKIYQQYYNIKEMICQMQIKLTDTDGIRFQVSTALIKEFHARGDHTEVRLYDGSRFNVREVPAEILNKISEVSNEAA